MRHRTLHRNNINTRHTRHGTGTGSSSSSSNGTVFRVFHIPLHPFVYLTCWSHPIHTSIYSHIYSTCIDTGESNNRGVLHIVACSSSRIGWSWTKQTDPNIAGLCWLTRVCLLHIYNMRIGWDAWMGIPYGHTDPSRCTCSQSRTVWRGVEELEIIKNSLVQKLMDTLKHKLMLMKILWRTDTNYGENCSWQQEEQ